MENHYEKLGLKRISCASQLTISDTVFISPDLAGNYPDRRSSDLSHACATPDYSYLVVFSISFPFSSDISISSPQLYHHRTNTELSDLYLSLHAMIESQHCVQHTPSTAYTTYSIYPKLLIFPSFS
jgi:hypothetical protein